MLKDPVHRPQKHFHEVDPLQETSLHAGLVLLGKLHRHRQPHGLVPEGLRLQGALPLLRSDVHPEAGLPDFLPLPEGSLPLPEIGVHPLAGHRLGVFPLAGEKNEAADENEADVPHPGNEDRSPPFLALEPEPGQKIEARRRPFVVPFLRGLVPALPGQKRRDLELEGSLEEILEILEDLLPRTAEKEGPLGKVPADLEKGGRGRDLGKAGQKNGVPDFLPLVLVELFPVFLLLELLFPFQDPDHEKGRGDDLAVDPEHEGEVIPHGMGNVGEPGIQGVFQARPAEGLFAPLEGLLECEAFKLPVGKLPEIGGEVSGNPVTDKGERSFQKTHNDIPRWLIGTNLTKFHRGCQGNSTDPFHMDNKTGFMIVMIGILRHEFPAVEIYGCAPGGMDMGLKKIGIIANTDKKDAVECTVGLRDWLERRGVEVVLEEEIARATGMTGGIPGKDLPASVELIAVLGGDGTLLSAARTVAGHEVPLMGINLGGFGFMTVINLNEMFPAMEEILKGRFRTSKRMMLEIGLPGAQAEKPVPPALNDVVINRGNLSRMIHLETFVDDRYLATFKADGLVLATPTGSTAYSLSAGGPIVFPELQSIILNPICPHTLTNRPMMLPPDAAIRVVLWTKEECATLTIDGQISHVIRSGEAIEVRKSKTLIHLVDSPSRSYLEVVRTKLGWGGLH